VPWATRAPIAGVSITISSGTTGPRNSLARVLERLHSNPSFGPAISPTQLLRRQVRAKGKTTSNVDVSYPWAVAGLAQSNIPWRVGLNGATKTISSSWGIRPRYAAGPVYFPKPLYTCSIAGRVHTRPSPPIRRRAIWFQVVGPRSRRHPQRLRAASQLRSIASESQFMARIPGCGGRCPSRISRWASRDVFEHYGLVRLDHTRKIPGFATKATDWLAAAQHDQHGISCAPTPGPVERPRPLRQRTFLPGNHQPRCRSATYPVKHCGQPSTTTVRLPLEALKNPPILSGGHWSWTPIQDMLVTLELVPASRLRHRIGIFKVVRRDAGRTSSSFPAPGLYVSGPAVQCSNFTNGFDTKTKGGRTSWPVIPSNSAILAALETALAFKLQSQATSRNMTRMSSVWARVRRL